MKQKSPKDVIRMFYLCKTEAFYINLNVTFLFIFLFFFLKKKSFYIPSSWNFKDFF